VLLLIRPGCDLLGFRVQVDGFYGSLRKQLRLPGGVLNEAVLLCLVVVAMLGLVSSEE
jgi:hypothetical protein